MGMLRTVSYYLLQTFFKTISGKRFFCNRGLLTEKNNHNPFTAMTPTITHAIVVCTVSTVLRFLRTVPLQIMSRLPASCARSFDENQDSF